MKILIFLTIIVVLASSCVNYDKLKFKPHLYNPTTKYNSKNQVKHSRKNHCPTYDRAHQVKRDENYNKCKSHSKIKK